MTPEPGPAGKASGLLGPPPAPGDPIRIGFQVWSMGIAWGDLMAAGERIEAMGFASLFANDHMMPVLGDADGPVVGDEGPVFEGWMTLAGWAARTSRVPLGTMVSAVGYRNVGLTVKMATALDHASGGRAILGVGAGWHEPEIEAFGYEPLSLGDRLSRLDEATRVARAMLDGDFVTHDGRWIRAHGMRNDPAPVHGRMPLLIAGSGERRTLRIVARDADIWNGEGIPEVYAHKAARARWMVRGRRARPDVGPAHRRHPAGLHPADTGRGRDCPGDDPAALRRAAGAGPRLGGEHATGRHRGGGGSIPARLAGGGRRRGHHRPSVTDR